MPDFATNGVLTTDIREIAISETWDSNSDWNQYQSNNNIEIVNGNLQLAEETIPDSGDLLAQYDAQALSLNDGESVSPWPDATGNGHNLTAGTAPTYVTNGINGNPSISFDSDYLSVSFTAETQPIHMFFVYQYQSVNQSGGDYLMDAQSGDRYLFGGNNDGNWIINSGNTIQGTAQDTTPHIANALYNGSNSKLDLDGMNVVSGNAGTNQLSNYIIGSEMNQDNYANAYVGQFLVYLEDKTAIEGDIESYLMGRWDF